MVAVMFSITNVDNDDLFGQEHGNVHEYLSIFYYRFRSLFFELVNQVINVAILFLKKIILQLAMSKTR